MTMFDVDTVNVEKKLQEIEDNDLYNFMKKQGYSEEQIKSAIRKYSLNLVSQDTEIKVSRLGERAGALGACLLSRSKMLGMIHY